MKPLQTHRDDAPRAHDVHRAADHSHSLAEEDASDEESLSAEDTIDGGRVLEAPIFAMWPSE